jgi:hypothetical protein
MFVMPINDYLRVTKYTELGTWDDLTINETRISQTVASFKKLFWADVDESKPVEPWAC